MIVESFAVGLLVGFVLNLTEKRAWQRQHAELEDKIMGVEYENDMLRAKLREAKGQML